MKTLDHGPTTSPTYRTQLVARTCAVLMALTREGGFYTLDQLSNELDLNKTSLFRILRSLEIEGLVQRSNERYRLGSRVLDLANGFLRNLSVHAIAQPYLEVMARECGSTTTLAILENLEVVYIAVEHAQRDVGIRGEIGQRYPAHATALGKVLLAYSGADALQQLGQQTLQRLTHRTIVDVKALADQFKDIRQRGFAVDDEERGIGIRCVAAPIFDYTDRAVASLSLSGPIFHMNDESIQRNAAALLKTVDRLSTELGSQRQAGGASTTRKDHAIKH